ncbi:type IV pilin N-terminal domain-containing protein [Halomarina rubra]|uniref:Type IV pilin N-terminal domain-containing protein n=1 Tax=Halomarina rubra TaxID=2071873 RepID=A0ABD6AV76_9EURY
MSRHDSLARDRALTPVAGALLLAITVVLAGITATALVTGVGETDLSVPATTAVGCSADADANRLSLTHRGGDALDPSSLRVRVRVAGDLLAHQPPVPFFAARGFRSGPTGPFNRGWAGEWTTGTTASVTLAGTNTHLDASQRVRVRLWADGSLVADCETRA